MFPLCCTVTGAKVVDLKREGTFLQILKNWGGMRKKRHVCQHQNGKLTPELSLSVKERLLI